MKPSKSLSLGLIALGVGLGAPVASAAVSKVICVPWQGDTTKYHTTLAGGGGMLKAVVKTTTTADHYYRWVYGDGTQSAVQTLTGSTWYVVEDSHAYAGATGTPFTAQLVVADNSGLTGATTDTYLVKIEANNLDARINVAIDNGLWYTYKMGTRSDGVSGSYLTYDGSPCVYWQSAGYRVAATSSAVQAFEINGSKESGDFDQDPYAEYSHLGLNFLLLGYVGNVNNPNLRSVSIGLVRGTDDPDANGNGIGIEVYDGGQGLPTYQGGQVMDALVASGTPGKSSGRDFVGNGHVATYAEILQDMADMYAWGQHSTCTYVQQDGSEDVSGNGVPASITLDMLNTQCSSGGTFELLLNGVSLGTVPNDPGNSCTCSPGAQVFVVNDAAALTAAWNADAGKLLRITYTGGGYNSRVSVTLDWGGGLTKTVCARSLASDCLTLELCSGYDGAAFTSDINLKALPVSVLSCYGSWRYSWNDDNDNSAAQWAAIGMIPAEAAPWNTVVPQFVKDLDDRWLDQSHLTPRGGNANWGTFGYTSRSGLGYPAPDTGATTPSGMVQLSFVDKPVTDPRWVRSERWMAENWDTGENWFGGAKNNLYAMYAMAKAMRLAKPAPVVNFAVDGFDWYRGSVTRDGVAKALSDTLIANGGLYPQTYWAGNPLETIWAVIILRPTLFAAAPVACATAHPNPAYSDLPITFDPACSGHSEPGKTIANLVKFEWDWDNNGTYDESSTTPVTKSHAFHCDTVPCAFPVGLRVTDDAGLTATFVLNINITDPPHPPVSRSKAEFWVSECLGDTLTLDGSASFDPDEGKKQTGCAACPVDTITAYEWDFDGAPFDYTSASGKIVNLGSAWSANFPTVGSHDIGLRVTDNTALAYPASGQPNLKDEAFSKVFVYQAGACDLGAVASCDSVHLAWSSTGAGSYRVYRSLTGPNADFVEVANTGTATTADVAAVFGQEQWFRVMGVTGNVKTLSKAVYVKLTATDCVCITTLKPTAKNKLVQLTWAPSAGATCYNVYRSTVANVPTDAAHRIAACVVTGVAVYNDSAVVNGTKYYYKVTKVVAGAEVCISNEVSATPTLPRR
jgi:hypothetical protein